MERQFKLTLFGFASLDVVCDELNDCAWNDCAWNVCL